MDRWEALFGEADRQAALAAGPGADAKAALQAAAALLARHDLHLTLGRVARDGLHLEIEVTGLGRTRLEALERRLGTPGLVARARAVPIDRVEALRAALREGRAAHYEDAVAFVGAALRGRPLLEALARAVTRLLALPRAVVAPVGQHAVICLAGRPAGPELVAPAAAWAGRLGQWIAAPIARRQI